MFLTFYFTNRCPDSVEFLSILHREGISNMFHKICVDGYSSKELFSLNLKILPALIVAAGNNSRPDVLQGPKPCFNWLNNMIQNRRANMAQIVNQQRKIIQEQHLAQKKAQGDYANGFNTDEMEGISDGYAYTNADIHQSKNFVPCGQEHLYNIMTPHFDDGKISESQLRQQMEQLERQRSGDNEQLKQIMEKNQIEAIIKGQCGNSNHF